MIFIGMSSDDFSTKGELLTLLPLKTTTRGVDIYNAVKEFLVEKNVPLEKLVSVTADGAPAMIGRHAGFIAHCKGDTDFPNFLHYHCIIHQQSLCAKVIGFEHVMTPVVKIINSIRSKAKQHRIFKVLLEELSAEYGDLLLHTEIRWLSRGRILHRFWSLLGEIKEFMQSRGEDTSLLEDTDWTLDLAFLTDITEKLNSLNRELQGKDFLKERGIKHIRTSGYHPQANRCVERFNRVLKDCIQGAQAAQKSRKPTVTVMLQSYRATPHATTNESPFQLLRGRPMRTKLHILPDRDHSGNTRN
ncbi:general transcription factor II-I repeat domain-containing protein 2-like isoform X1 [Dunckerocampus dactyliophorus]|uniref:general transcription factor II-I repeat domain-containing protein 2-like isoform X1 n=1 Tax=Dunckerocampus dactyliophorus TaxID=161453 RepID=UPI00240759A4|nr:general transcription factor II-I repeat domain-containing protein 2-like isoform X1 [Dunckerocampus dactyliophorus]